MLNGFTDWCRSLFSRSPKAEAQAPARTANYGDIPSSESQRPWSDDEWLQKAKTCAALATPLDRLETDVAAVPWHLYELGEPGPDGRPKRRELLSHPLLDLWRQPNPRMSGTQFRRLWTHYHDVRGRVPIRVMYGATGFPERLWVLKPSALRQWCNLASDKPRERVWRVLWNKKEIELPPHEMFVVTRPDPDDPYGWGVGLVEALRSEVEQLGWMGKWTSNFFRLGAHIGKIVGIPGLTPQSKPGIVSDFTRDHTGPDNVGKTLFVGLGPNGGQISVVNAGPTQKEMDYVAGQKLLYQRCRQRFGIPPELVGDVENSNRATADAAKQIHQRENVKPRVLEMAEVVNTFLTPLFDAEGRLVLLPEDPVEETQEQRHAEADDGWRGGTLTRNRWLHEHGFDPLPPHLGDVFCLPLNTALQDMTGAIVPVATPAGVDTPATQPDSPNGGATEAK